MEWKDLRLIVNLTLIGAVLSGCLTPEKDELANEPATEETPEFGSFLPDEQKRKNATNSPLPERDYSKIDYATWESNPRDAMRRAIALDRPLLILLTAPSWSENSQKFNHEVVLSQTFNDFVRDKLVLSFLDYPQRITNAPDSMRKFKERYQVRGYPTILLLDHEGRELWRRTGYSPGRAKDYFEDFKTAINRHE